MAKLSDMARLKELLLSMEKDLGMDDLSGVQKNIVYAATMLVNKKDEFETEAIRNHALLRDVSRSSFFRALKNLTDAGYIKHRDGTQRASYQLLKK